jgi:hypothetical protein
MAPIDNIPTAAPRMTDLGDDKRFPVELAPCDAETISRWTRACFSEPNPRELGVPPAFRNGVLHGFMVALDGSIAGLRENIEDPGIARVVGALEVLKDLFPEAADVGEAMGVAADAAGAVQ